MLSPAWPTTHTVVLEEPVGQTFLSVRFSYHQRLHQSQSSEPGSRRTDIPVCPPFLPLETSAATKLGARFAIRQHPLAPCFRIADHIRTVKQRMPVPVRPKPLYRSTHRLQARRKSPSTRKLAHRRAP